MVARFQGDVSGIEAERCHLPAGGQILKSLFMSRCAVCLIMAGLAVASGLAAMA